MLPTNSERQRMHKGMLVAVGVVVAVASAGDVVIDDFEDDALREWQGLSLKWVDGAGRDFGKALFELSINRDSRYVKQGRQSLRFRSWAAEEGGYVILAKRLSKQSPGGPTAPSSLELDTLSLWIYRKEGTGAMTLRLFAPGGKHVAADIDINFDGWRRFTFGPGDWRGKGCKWQEIWNDLYLLYPVCHGKFDIYVDDLRFTSSKAREKEAETSASPASQDRKDTIYADFGGRGTKGLKFVSASLQSTMATTKDRKKCLLLDGPAQSWRYLFLDADDQFRGRRAEGDHGHADDQRRHPHAPRHGDGAAHQELRSTQKENESGSQLHIHHSVRFLWPVRVGERVGI